MRFLVVLFVLIFMFMHTTAEAFRLLPFKAYFAAAGEGAKQAYYLENSSNRQIAVEIIVKKLEMKQDGTEIRSSTKDFLVYPRQLILAPQEKKEVYVKYQGVSPLSKELSYRVLVRQLPVRFNKDLIQRSKVNLAFHYEALAYVVPKDARSQIELIGYEVAVRDGIRQIKLVMENRGNAHSSLERLFFDVEGQGGEIKTIRGDLLFKGQKATILAGGRRAIDVAVPAELPELIRSVTVREGTKE